MSVLPVPATSPLPQALAGRTAVIIGGSSGIGLAAGALLTAVGARVVLVGRDQDRLDAAVKHVGGDALGVSAEVSDERSLERAFELAGTVDHVLVTAGGFGGGALESTPGSEVRHLVDSRVWGAYTAARLAARRLPAGGSITFSSGVYATRPLPGVSAAVAALGAVESLTRALAVELAPRRLRVNTIRFGIFDTPLSRGAFGAGHDSAGDQAVAEHGATLPLGRFGTPEEAASAALFVMANAYVTGTVLTVDGGASLA